MKKTLLRILQFTIFLALTVFLVYIVLKGTDFRKIGDDLLHANYWWIGIVIILGWLAYVVRAYRWNLLIEPLGYYPSVTNSYHAVAIGYIANIAFPRMGELSKCISLNRTNKIPLDSLVGTILIERAIDMVSLLILLLIIFIGKFESFGIFISEKILDPLYQKLVHLIQASSNFIYIGAGILGVLVLASYVFRKQLAKVHLVHRIRKILKGVTGGLKTVYKMRKRMQFILATIALWTLYFFMTYLVFFAIPESSHLTPIDGLFILVVGSFGMVAPVQGGFGAYHGMLILGFSLYGISADKGLVVAVLCHESQTLMVIVAGVISLIKVFFSKKLVTQTN